jgi:type II secretory pathway component PulM
VTSRNRRALLLGAGMIAAAFVLLRVVPWGGRAMLAWRGRVAEQQGTLARERALLTAVPQLRDSLARALAEVVALAPRLAAVGSSAEASATLASLVSLGATQHGLKIVRMDPLPDSLAGIFTQVAVHAELEGDVGGLVRMLRAMETGDPLLTVVALSVDALAPTAPRNAPQALHITLTIAGYALRKGAG